METSARTPGESPGNQRAVDSGRSTAVTDQAIAPFTQLNQPEKGTMVQSMPHDGSILKETVEVMKEITPTWRMWDMHAIMQQLHEAYQLKKPLCFKIQDETPDNMWAMLSLWQHNPEGVPTAIRQEDDGSLNLSNVDFWMWLRATTPTKGMMAR